MRPLTPAEKKWRKRQAKLGCWIREMAKEKAERLTREEVENYPELFPTSGPEREKEIEEYRQQLEEEIILNESPMTAKKRRIEDNMTELLAARCGKELAKRLIGKISFKDYTAEALDTALSELIKQKELCRDPETVESQWDEFARPYRDQETELELGNQEKERRKKEIIRQRKEEARLRKAAEQQAERERHEKEAALERIKELEAQLKYSKNQSAQLIPKKPFVEIGLFGGASDRPNSPEEKIMHDQGGLQATCV